MCPSILVPRPRQRESGGGCAPRCARQDPLRALPSAAMTGGHAEAARRRENFCTRGPPLADRRLVNHRRSPPTGGRTDMDALDPRQLHHLEDTWAGTGRLHSGRHRCPPSAPSPALPHFATLAAAVDALPPRGMLLSLAPHFLPIGGSSPSTVVLVVSQPRHCRQASECDGKRVRTFRLGTNRVGWRHRQWTWG